MLNAHALPFDERNILQGSINGYNVTILPVHTLKSQHFQYPVVHIPAYDQLNKTNRKLWNNFVRFVTLSATILLTYNISDTDLDNKLASIFLESITNSESLQSKLAILYLAGSLLLAQELAVQLSEKIYYKKQTHKKTYEDLKKAHYASSVVSKFVDIKNPPFVVMIFDKNEFNDGVDVLKKTLHFKYNFI